MKHRGLATGLSLVIALLIVGLVTMPQIGVALTRAHKAWGTPLPSRPPPDDPKAFDARPGPPKGRLVGDHWVVEEIAPGTFAIGEPQGDLDNYEYLLIGTSRALLIDAGAATDDLHAVAAGLTDLPITVIPTHLHFDHTHGLAHFSDIALIDLPETRAHLVDGKIDLHRYNYGLPLDDEAASSFAVTQWVAPDSLIDLGDRSVQVLWTPGHTATSVTLFDAAAGLAFTGDLIYTTTLYAYNPDSSLSAYVATFDRLLAKLPPATKIYGAHCCRNDAPPEAPWLAMEDVRDAKHAIEAIIDHTASGKGGLMRRFPVNSRMTILTYYPFGNW